MKSERERFSNRQSLKSPTRSLGGWSGCASDLRIIAMSPGGSGLSKVTRNDRTLRNFPTETYSFCQIVFHQKTTENKLSREWLADAKVVSKIIPHFFSRF